jgi:hypothetical protein
MTFQRIVHVVNRTFDRVLQVTDDGIPWQIRPGYRRVEDAEGNPVLSDEGKEQVLGAGPGGTVFMEPLPYFAAERAIRQNPVMGTEDPLNPNAFESLVAVPDWGHDYSPLQQSDAIERLDRSQMSGDAQTAIVMTAIGGRRPTAKKNPKTGKFEKVISGARGMVANEAVPVNPGLSSRNIT